MEYKTSEAQRLRSRKWYEDNRKRKSEINKTANLLNKVRIMSHYSKGTPTCSCCGEKEIDFLSIDHINGGGRQHRKMTGSGRSFYTWLIKNNFPEEFRVLCLNCNFAIGHYGVCPHKRKKDAL